MKGQKTRLKKTEKKAALETRGQRHDTCTEQGECGQKAAGEWNVRR